MATFSLGEASQGMLQNAAQQLRGDWESFIQHSELVPEEGERERDVEKLAISAIGVLQLLQEHGIVTTHSSGISDHFIDEKPGDY